MNKLNENHHIKKIPKISNSLKTIQSLRNLSANEKTQFEFESSPKLSQAFLNGFCIVEHNDKKNLFETNNLNEKGNFLTIFQISQIGDIFFQTFQLTDKEKIKPINMGKIYYMTINF